MECVGKNQEEHQKVCNEIREMLMKHLEVKGDAGDEEIKTLIDELVISYSHTVYMSLEERRRVSRELFASVRKLDILQELVDDPEVTEIMVNGPDQIYVEKHGKIRLWNRRFSSSEKLEDVIQIIVGQCNRVVNESHPIVDARLAGSGARVNAVVRPVALGGPILTIRCFPKIPITMEKLINLKSVTQEAADFLKKAVEAGYSIIISGGTSAGKTTFLNALSNDIPKDERIITIEDNAELQIQGIENLVRLEAKEANMEGSASVTIRQLIKSSLRMRPDRIVVGEVRSGEAVDMLQAFNTGHDGSLCTIHANSAYDAISRLETMVLMAFPLPIPAIRRQIASGVNIFVQLSRMRDKSRRVLEISEVDGMKGEEVLLHPLFLWEDKTGTLKKRDELHHKEKLLRTGVKL